jgi:hypothetical protein
MTNVTSSTTPAPSTNVDLEADVQAQFGQFAQQSAQSMADNAKFAELQNQSQLGNKIAGTNPGQ